MISDALTSIITRAYLAAKREEGQTFVEYSLIAVFVGLAVIFALTAFVGDISAVLTKIGNGL